MAKQTLLIVLGGGGHTEQMLNLVDMLGKKYNYEYVVGDSDVLSQKRIRLPGKIFKLSNPRTMQDKNPLIVTLKLVPYTLEAKYTLFKSHASAMVICGPAISVPIAFLGKLFFRKKLIFIESWSRVKSKSLSGKLIGWLSDIVFVQWKENKNYRNSIYAGRLG
jgi:UDP-N-acetylglucosamine:LPS N-acetylglucosamine transferase